MAPLNSTMIVVALPEILADLGASLTWGSWIVISYLVAMAAMQPLGGSLGDRYGRRRLLLIGSAAMAAILGTTAGEGEFRLLFVLLIGVAAGAVVTGARLPSQPGPRSVQSWK